MTTTCKLRILWADRRDVVVFKIARPPSIPHDDDSTYLQVTWLKTDEDEDDVTSFLVQIGHGERGILHDFPILRMYAPVRMPSVTSTIRRRWDSPWWSFTVSKVEPVTWPRLTPDEKPSTAIIGVDWDRWETGSDVDEGREKEEEGWDDDGEEEREDEDEVDEEEYNDDDVEQQQQQQQMDE